MRTRPKKLRECAALAAVLLASGCDPSLPWSGREGLDPPADLTASADPVDFDIVHLTWVPAALPDHYELQGRVGDGGWQTLNPSIGPAVAAFPIWIAPTTPERTQLTFRLRGVTNLSTSRWSSDAVLLRGVRPPSAFAAEMGLPYQAHTGPVIVTWTNESQVATAIQLDRSPLDDAGAPTSWAPLADATLGAGTYVDRLLEDGVAYAYRARVGVDGVWSLAREARTPAVDLAAPWGLRAAVEGGAVRLTWTNQSTTADAVTVTRFTRGWPHWDTHVDLPAAQSSWLDPLPMWPVVSYQITASRPSAYLFAQSEVAAVEPFTLPGPPALAASPRRLPEGEWVARDASGRFHVAQEIYETPRVHRATAAGHETYVLPDALYLADPGVVLDSQGAPHVLYLRAADDGVRTDLVHAWWDGAAWHSEVVATDDVGQWRSNVARAWFGLDASDALQILYRRSDALPGQEALVHLARTVEGWEATEVATPSVPDFWRWSVAFAVSSDGWAHVVEAGQSVARSANLIVACARSPEGAWADEVVPTGAIGLETPLVAAGAAGNLAIAYGDGIPEVDVVVLRKIDGAWSSPELVLTQDPGASSLSLAVAPRFEGDRLALVVSWLGRAEVHVRDASGWNGVAVGPSSVHRAWLGFGPSGDAWALFPHDSASLSETLPYSLFEEVR